MNKGDKFKVSYREGEVFVVDEITNLNIYTECGETFASGDCEPADENEKQTEFTFHLGNVKISTSNINELKEYVSEIAEKLAPGEEHSKHISDFIYDVESAYQQFHDLDEDNWDIVH